MAFERFTYTLEEYEVLPNNLHRSCVDCRWHTLVNPETNRPVTSSMLALCLNPKQGKNMVTGEARIQHCYWHRNNRNLRHSCNGRAHWWEERATPLDTPRVP